MTHGQFYYQKYNCRFFKQREVTKFSRRKIVKKVPKLRGVGGYC